MNARLASLIDQIERQDFEIYCAQNADSAYYTSGRYDADAKKLAALQKELEIEIDL